MYKGKHKPMITRDEFEAVQSMLNKKSQPRPISRYFTYGSCTFHCGECGGAISGYNRIKKQKNGNIHSYIYYQCSRNNSNCSQTNIKEEHIESQVINILKSITFPERLFSLVIEGNVIDIDQELKEYESKMANTKLAYQNAKKKIDGLIDLRSRDQISEEQFIRIKSQTETELNRLNEQLENKSYNIIDWNTFLNKALLFGSLALNKFTEGTPEQKRNILSNLSSNLTITDKNIDIQRIKWYLPFKSLSKSINEINDKIEPPTTLKNNDKIEFSKNYSLVCSLVKDVKTTIYNNPQREWFPIVDEWNKAQKAIPP